MSSNQTPRKPRRPGRPPRSKTDEPAVRARLVEAAAQLFAEKGYRGASVRQIADAASVTPAMVAYYFNGKLGLLEEVLDSVFTRLLSRTVELTEASRSGGSTLETFIDIYLKALTAEPWIPHFLVREVLSENTPVRERFVERFASRAAQVVPALMQEQIDAGRLRRDLDPQLAVLSLIGMCIFPLIAEPVVGPLLGYRSSPEFVGRLTRHTQSLFLQGAQEPNT